MVTGQNLDELRANALAAEAHYAARQAAPPPAAKVNVGLYPNPVTRGSVDCCAQAAASASARVRRIAVLDFLNIATSVQS